jgi:hypothetical protein
MYPARPVILSASIPPRAVATGTFPLLLPAGAGQALDLDLPPKPRTRRSEMAYRAGFVHPYFRLFRPLFPLFFTEVSQL